MFDRKTFAHLGNFRLRASGTDWTGSTDGIDVFQGPATVATGGIFAACDGCGHHGQSRDELDIVGWDQIAASLGLMVCPNGIPEAQTAVDSASTGFTTMMDLKLLGQSYCNDAMTLGILDGKDSGKLKTSGSAILVFGSGSSAGDIQGTLTIDLDPRPMGPGPIAFNFIGRGLAKSARKGFMQLEATSARGSDLLITGPYSLSKKLDQITSFSAAWQGSFKENGFDCFSAGKLKARKQK